MHLADLAIRRPVTATVASLLLVILGLVSLGRLPVREYPNVDRPTISINTSYRGASASIIEDKITQPIEDQIAGLEGISRIDSESEDERSSIRVEFDIGRDLDGAANDVRDRVARVVSMLPAEADPPLVLKADSSADPVIFVSFEADRLSILEVTDYAERHLVDAIGALPGVARVGIIGGRRYAIRVWIDRAELAARRLTVVDIENALLRENTRRAAGRIESRAREFPLRTDTGLDSVEAFRRLVIGRGDGNRLIRLGDVADVELAAENERAVARTNGRPGIDLSVEAQSTANALSVVRAVRERLASLRDSLPAGTALGINLDRGRAIEAALNEVLIALVLSSISVLLVIYLFLGSVRATLIPAVTIPVSIIATFIVMDALGYSINVLTLLGLVLAIGLVVDDAIVVLENIHRHAEDGAAPEHAAARGTREVALAVIATTSTLVAVFVPISFLPGDIGRLFREFGFTLAAAVGFSALVALTLVPVLAARLPGSARRAASGERLNAAFRSLARVYERLLRGGLRRPLWVGAGIAALAASAILSFRSLPTEFAPVADIGFAVVGIDAAEGTGLEAMQGYGLQLERLVQDEMKRLGEIGRVMLRIPGTGGANAATGDVNSARALLVLEDWRDRGRSAAEITASLVRQANMIPGVQAFGSQAGSLGRRGFGKPVQAVLGGPDYESLSAWSTIMVERARANPGLIGVDTNYTERKVQLRVVNDRDRAADLGVSLDAVGRTLETMLGSRVVTTYVDRGREYSVVLQGARSQRQAGDDALSIAVRSDTSGDLVPLSSIVRLEEDATAMKLNRFNRLRAVKISAGLAPGYTMGEAVRWFRDTVASELPAGATLTFDGESAEFAKGGQQMYVTFAFALAIVFLVLAAQFESFRLPAIVLTTVPLALVGAIPALKFHGEAVNIFSQIACVLLIGIAAKNGVLIVEFANQMRSRGTARLEAVVAASLARLRPILMTSLCTAFGALPFLLASGAGAEQRRPIGVVVFYGTMASVALTLFVVPVVYLLVSRKDEPAAQ